MKGPLRQGLAGVLLALAVAGAGPAAAALRRVEAVGAAPIPAAAPPAEAPRDAAVRAALRDAVQRVALDQLPGVPRARAEALVAEALGGDPLPYATRFRIVEDRGERPALFADDATVRAEYVVLVEVHVDVDRVRERLRARGLLEAPSGEGPAVRVRLVVEDLESYAAFAALRRTLVEDVGVRSALPLELERGRAVIAVDGDLGPRALLQQLRRRAGPELQITPLDAERDTLTVRVRLEAAPGEAPQPASPGSAPRAAD